jgi:glycosyltransferase involved in cell wall biosynthesis
MLKVLHIIPSLPKGGAERLVTDICSELTTQNLAEVLLVVMNEINEYEEFTRNIQIKYCPSWVRPSISGSTQVDLYDFRKIVDMFKPDIIHSHLYEAELLSRWEIFPHVAYITHCHDNMSQLKKISFSDKWNKRRITDYFERKILLKRYKECDNNFIAISHDTELFFRENIPMPSEKMNLLHNAINFDKFYRPDKLEAVKQKQDLIKLISVGSFVEKKNQSFLIDVVKIMRDRGYAVTLKLLGDGADREKIEKKIVEYNLTNFIYCVGNVNDVENYLHDANIYVHSATYEPFGLVLIEAMAAGLPVVCLDGKGNRDIMKDNYNGFMIWQNDVELFSEKIIQLTADEEMYDRISENAVTFARDHDIKNYVQQLSEIYKKVSN